MEKRSSDRRILVTGGSGFLGQYICRALLKEGYHVRSFGRKPCRSLERLGIEVVRGDILDYQSVYEASKQCSAVIHTAAKAGIWGKKKEYHEINVRGTQHTLRAAQANQIRRFVYTSSPSVTFQPREEITGSDESIPYSSAFLCHYPHSKMLAEKTVQESYPLYGIKAVTLRPHLIWGPNDPHFLPRILERARSGRLVKVGNQKNMVDAIYVENAAIAHINALKALERESEKVVGECYFIGQEHPVNLWEFIEALLNIAGEKRITRRMPFWFAYVIGSILEHSYLIRKKYHSEPMMTRFLACQLSQSHYFSHQRAKTDLDFVPKYTINQGLKILRDHLRKNHVTPPSSKKEKIKRQALH